MRTVDVMKVLWNSVVVIDSGERKVFLLRWTTGSYIVHHEEGGAAI